MLSNSQWLCPTCGNYNPSTRASFDGRKNRAYQKRHPEYFAQPFNNDGSVNKKFTEAYGKQDLKGGRL